MVDTEITASMGKEETGVVNVAVAGERNGNRDDFRWWCSIFREKVRLVREAQNTVGPRPSTTGKGHLTKVDRVAWEVLSFLFKGPSIETVQISRSELRVGAGG